MPTEGVGAPSTPGGSPAPRGHPSATTETGVTFRGKSERPARLPHRPQGQRRGRRAEAACGRREEEVLHGGEGRAVEGGRADRGEERPPAGQAGHDQHRDVLEVVGLPLAILEQRVVAPAAAQDPLVDRPALAVGAGELVADVGVAHHDERARAAAGRCWRGRRGRGARARSSSSTGSLRSRRCAACARA